MLEVFYANQYDDNHPIGAPWRPNRRLEYHGQKAWEMHWIGVLNQLLLIQPADGFQSDYRFLTQYVLEAISTHEFNLTEDILKTFSDRLAWHEPYRRKKHGRSVQQNSSATLYRIRHLAASI